MALEILRPVLKGKKALLVGVANEHSIAFGYAKAFHELGTDLAITYLNEKAKAYVEPLARTLESLILIPLDVAKPGELEAVFAEIRKEWDQLDILGHLGAFAPKEDLQSGLLECSADGFGIAMDFSCQREYFEKDRNGNGVPEYAQNLISDPGEKNGLYCKTCSDEPPSPIGPLVADAVEEGYGSGKKDHSERRPFHGYYFNLLLLQGPSASGGARDYVVYGRMTDGFAIVAWPAEYENSGVMTFLASHQGIVYQKNIGRNTARNASTMSVFDPDPQWSLE